MPKAAARYRTSKEHKTSNDARRGTRTERGYDNRWLRFRLSYLREHPLCCDCLGDGRSTPATEVHHIERLSKRPDLKFELSNLRALCKRCHTLRTNRGE